LPDRDFLCRTLIAFLPGAGVLYCPRERRGAKVGVGGSLTIPLDMSWLQLHEDATAEPGRRYSFGEDSLCEVLFGGLEWAGRSAAYDHCMASVDWPSLGPEHHAASDTCNAVLRCQWTAQASPQILWQVRGYHPHGPRRILARSITNAWPDQSLPA
jgi:hypothetical protein